jgi:hypothetical protein
LTPFHALPAAEVVKHKSVFPPDVVTPELREVVKEPLTNFSTLALTVSPLTVVPVTVTALTVEALTVSPLTVVPVTVTALTVEALTVSPLTVDPVTVVALTVVVVTVDPKDVIVPLNPDDVISKIAVPL